MFRNTLLMMGVSFVLAKTRDGGRSAIGKSSISGPSIGSRYSIDNYIGVSRTAPLLEDRLMRSGYPPLDQALAGHGMDDLDNSDRLLTGLSATLPQNDGGFNFHENTRGAMSESIYTSTPGRTVGYSSSSLPNGPDSYGHYSSHYSGPTHDSSPILDTSEPQSMAGPGRYSGSSRPITSGSRHRYYPSHQFGPMYESLPAPDSGPFGPVPRLFEKMSVGGSDAFPRYRSATSMVASPRFRSASSLDASPRYRSTILMDASPRYRLATSMEGSPRFRSASPLDGSPRYRSTVSADAPTVGGKYHSFLHSSGPLYDSPRVSGSEDQMEGPTLTIPTYGPTPLRGFDTSPMSGSGEPMIMSRGPRYERAPLRGSAYSSIGSARPMDTVGYQYPSYRARPMYGQMPSGASDPVGTMDAPVLGGSYDYSMYRSGQGSSGVSFMSDSSALSRSGPNEDMMRNGYRSSIYNSYGSSGILPPVSSPSSYSFRSYQYNPSTVDFGVHLSGKHRKNGR